MPGCWIECIAGVSGCQPFEALGKIGDPLALEALHARLASQSRSLRLAVLTALGKIAHERSLEPLLEALAGAKESVDNELVMIVEILGQIGHPRIADRLAGLLEHPLQEVRIAAIEALGRIGDPRQEKVLREFLQNPELRVCEAAAKALGRLESPGALKLLRSKLSAEAAWQRAAALGGLAQSLDELDKKLLSRNCDGEFPFWDPENAITALYVDRAAQKLETPKEEVLRRLERVAEIIPLRFA